VTFSNKGRELCSVLFSNNWSELIFTLPSKSKINLYKVNRLGSSLALPGCDAAFVGSCTDKRCVTSQKSDGRPEIRRGGSLIPRSRSLLHLTLIKTRIQLPPMFSQSKHKTNCGAEEQTSRQTIMTCLGTLQKAVLRNYLRKKQSRNRPGVAQRVPGGLGSQISWHSARECGEVVSLTHRPPLPPRMFLVLILETTYCAEIYKLNKMRLHQALQILSKMFFLANM
jgi:hypothetical protein